MKQTKKNAFIAISVTKKVMLTAILLFNTSCGREGLLEAVETDGNSNGSIRTDSEASINSSSSKSSIKSAASMAAKAFTWSYKGSGVVTSLCTKAVTSTYGWLFGDSSDHKESTFFGYIKVGDGPILYNGNVSEGEYKKNVEESERIEKATQVLRKMKAQSLEKKRKEKARSLEMKAIEIPEQPQNVQPLLSPFALEEQLDKSGLHSAEELEKTSN